jgi:hypothetical protein
MKNILLRILIFLFNLIIKPITRKLNIQFYNLYSKEILKLIINTTNSLSFWNIFNLILLCLKNKMFKDIEDNTILKLNSDLENLSSNYKKGLVAFKLDFISYMLTLSFIFKFISTFWYLILIFPLRTFINFIILLFVGLDLNYFIDILNEVIYPYLISTFDYYKTIFNEFKVNLNNLISSSKVENLPVNKIENISPDPVIESKSEPVWSDDDIKLMQQMKDDYAKTNNALQDLNVNKNNSINPAWYVLGACGILFLGIGVYIYFVVDRSVDAAVQEVIDSVKDKNITKGWKGGIDPATINDAVTQIHSPSNSNTPTPVGESNLLNTTPKKVHFTLPVNENPVASTSAVTPDLTNIAQTTQDGLHKVGEGIKNIASNVSDKTQAVAGKVTTTVKDTATKLSDQGRVYPRVKILQN